MRRVFLPLLALAILSGCYTVLRHPRVESDVEEPDPVVVRSDCAACHSDWDLERYGYAFHPGWYPVYGAWPRWYYDPWWADVVVADRQVAPQGVQVEQSAGLKNDRGPAGGSAAAPGVWMPGGGAPAPSGTGTLLDPGPRPRASDPPSGPGDPTPSAGGHSGTPAATPARPGAGASTPVGPQPAQPVDEPRPGSGSPTTPTTHQGSSTSNPRGPSSGNVPAKQPADAGRPATPSPTPPSTPPPPEGHVEPQPSQGRGMGNDRGEPKP
jgi:hypothetical protein